MKSIIIIIDYFGKWPPWFPIFLESCRHNPTIDWLFHTDCPFEGFNVPNVKFKFTSKENYIKYVSETLNIKFTPQEWYKLTDMKPATGYLYAEEIKGYDFFGYGDIDLIYGDIRKFYTDAVLENNIISTHEWCLSGHLSLIRNKSWLRAAFKQIKNWKKFLEEPTNQRFDEDIFTQVFKPRELSIVKPNLFGRRYHKKLYFLEQYTTPLTPTIWRDGTINHPQTWYWKNGKITADGDNVEEYIYFHFMNFKEARYMDSHYGKKAFWNGLPSIVHITPEEISKGVRIDRFGFHPIDTQCRDQNKLGPDI
ncbi:hypothetical protein A3860_05470 [Niastella vici]|uniref:Uncharacterized protein n=1 Tax=Niastella vici TaxID=1703345 RepID=A0A1V9FSE9_9BACT|nr:DUF6625 family protein [Niastella vici]OQP61166.1 hypothetical protein A3860_05470 [Niastella vici]